MTETVSRENGCIKIREGNDILSLYRDEMKTRKMIDNGLKWKKTADKQAEIYEHHSKIHALRETQKKKSMR